MAEAAEKKAETAEKKADEGKAEEVKADDKPDASAAAAVIEEDLFEDFPFGEEVEAEEGIKARKELPLWAADWDDSETTDFAARLKEELSRARPAAEAK